MAIETEIKFVVPDRALFDRIISLEEIAKYRTVDKGLKKISDTYFDTQDNRLFNGEIVFRLRVLENKSVLTFKAHIKSAGSFYRRLEIESDTNADADDISSGNLPDIPPVKAFLDKMGNVSLSTSLKAENSRHTILLTHSDIPHYELVLDDVTFKGPRGASSVCELEVESLIETGNDLENIGAWLKQRFDLQPAGPSKYILGMKLVGNV